MLRTERVYRFSRNPHYAGLIAALAGMAIGRRSGLALATVAASAVVLDRWIRHEEAHLDRVFSQTYRRYADQAPRWMGRPAR